MDDIEKWAARGRWLVDKLSERQTPNGTVLELVDENIAIRPDGTLSDYIAAVDAAMERDQSRYSRRNTTGTDMTEHLTDRERALSEQIDRQGGKIERWRDRAIAAEAGLAEYTQAADKLAAENKTLRDELARLRAVEPVSWKHDCAGLCTNGVELWIDACPHCGKPRAAPPAQPALSQKDKEQAAFEDWLIAECPSGDVEAVQRQWEESSEYLELQDDAPAQPAHADEFRCPLCLDDPANIAQPAEPPRCKYCDGTGDVHTIDGEWRGRCTECDGAQPAEPVQRLSDEQRRQLIEVLRGGRQCDEDGTEIIMSRQACCEAADIIESALQPGWRDIESAPKDGTEVLVYVRGYSLYPTAAAYKSARHFDKEYGDPDYMEEGWYWAFGYPSDFHEEPISPTHWMPLPPAPKATK